VNFELQKYNLEEMNMKKAVLKNRASIKHFVLLGIITISLFLQTGFGGVAHSSTKSANITLNVALYKYVPRLDQFKQEITAAWTKSHSDVTLNFVDWDCYSDDPPSNLDVFVFDAVFLDYFVNKGYLARLDPKDIDYPNDFVPYALNDSKLGGFNYAIPQLGCGDILFYHQGDKALEQAKTLSDVYRAIQDCSNTCIPPNCSGPASSNLLVDLSGGTTDSCFYVETSEHINGVYNPTPPLPPAGNLDSRVIANLKKLVSMACKDRATYSPPVDYFWAGWFGKGFGRATVGFTESMSAMGEARKGVAFKLLPLAEENDVHLFYSDLVGINASVTDPERKAASLKLANLMTSQDVLVNSIGVGSTKTYPAPQFLMPVRWSVFSRLMKQDPLYVQMFALAAENNPRLFRLGPDARLWIKNTKAAIKQSIFN
jgi:thiamine pyridinylase